MFQLHPPSQSFDGNFSLSSDAVENLFGTVSSDSSSRSNLPSFEANDPVQTESSKTKLKEKELRVESSVVDLEDGEISESDNEGKPNVDDDKRGTSNRCDDKIARNKSCKTTSQERNSLDKISDKCETRNIGNKSDNEITCEKPHSNRNYRKKTSDDSEIKPSNSDCEHHEKLSSREKNFQGS